MTEKLEAFRQLLESVGGRRFLVALAYVALVMAIATLIERDLTEEWLSATRLCRDVVLGYFGANTLQKAAELKYGGTS